MNRQSRIILCRLSFITFCVTPTLAVAAWILWPDAAANWEATLSARLEVDVSIEVTRQPRVGTTVMHGVQFHDPETGAAIARIERAELTTNQQGTLVLVSQAQVPWSQLDRLYEVLHQRSLRRWQIGDEPFSLRIQKLQLVPDQADSTSSSTPPTQVLHDVGCKIGIIESAPVAKIWFSVDEQQTADPVEIRITRKRMSANGAAETNKAFTQLFMQTNGNSIPCRALAFHLPQLSALGDDCHFAGMIWIEETGNDLRGEVDGRLERVDLDRLVSQRFPHQLSGVARIELQDVVIQNGRLQHATGSLQCEQGVVSNSLLAAAVSHLGLRVDQLPAGAATAFRSLKCGFQIDQRSLAVYGRNDSRGTLMYDDSAVPLLVQSAPTSQHDVFDLVRMLAPDSTLQIPLTEATASLMDVMPVGHFRRK